MEILFQVRVLFNVCSHSSKMLLVLNVSSIACSVIALAVYLYSCSSADSCTSLTLWKAGLLSCSSRKPSYFCSSIFLLICLSPAFLQDLRSVGARDMQAEATQCVATLTQVVSIAVGGMSRTAELCGIVSLSGQTRVG